MRIKTAKINRLYTPNLYKRDTQQLTKLDKAIAKTLFFGVMTLFVLSNLHLKGII